MPASALVVGVQCGGSDAFSGVTANPAVGFATDLLVRAGATVLFSETTEVRDAIDQMTARATTPEVAQAMVLGALNHSKAQVALAVTGIAGPSGGSRAKPVGTVCFAWALPSDTGPTLGAETAWVKVETCHFEGDRAAVRQATHAHAIERLLELWHQR